MVRAVKVPVAGRTLDEDACGAAALAGAKPPAKNGYKVPTLVKRALLAR